MLSIAYGSSIGGIATVIGSPPNGAMKAFLENQYQVTVSFFDWMAIGFPFAMVLMLLGYFLMTRFIFPNKLGNFDVGTEVIGQELEELGPWTRPEKITFAVFVVAALLWMSQDVLNSLVPALKLNDVGIAVLCGVALFLIPASRTEPGQVLEWKDTRNLHWGVLLMFGGGLSLAKAFKASGWVDTITTQLSFLKDLDVHHYVILLCLVGLVLTALMSNLAMVNIFVPVVAALAVATGQPPAMFAIPVTIAASCDFMFPMSTPPNAIAYSSGWVHARDMFRAGIVLNLVSWALLSAMVYLLI
jgi:sodium-dependent dicarboxylate transporter 2/3/5